jgi:translation initiation factor eIF-2B subunit alpha
MNTLLRAHERKRISVYVTEARPRGLGFALSSVTLEISKNTNIFIESLRTYEELTAAGIPCTVVLDSAVSYVMDKVDFVLVGSEAVVESGGLINAVGSNQIAIIAQAANIPFYALAERSVQYIHSRTSSVFIAFQLQIPPSVSSFAGRLTYT